MVGEDDDLNLDLPAKGEVPTFDELMADYEEGLSERDERPDAPKAWRQGPQNSRRRQDAEFVRQGRTAIDELLRELAGKPPDETAG